MSCMPLREYPHRFRSVDGEHDPISIPLQRPLRDLANGRLVVHDQDQLSVPLRKMKILAGTGSPAASPVFAGK